ncbi:cysteine hydrolase [Rhodovastum atsumiense]|uniref:Cysteine hydrolase n=2 Tax=Rhodovastum atsumiense TaxID=504468 RepID=A0A5M6J0V8_9PROT|nr:cysteine hydrolase [Rhodovastum atsumiense]
MSPPHPVVIDCDPGTDDAIALLLALASPELEVRLVTAVGGNVGLGRTLANARAVVGLSGRAVPVMAGADRPIMGRFAAAAYVHGEDGLGGVALPEGPPAAPGLAADAIRALLRAAVPCSVTLIGIGPATNLGLALATEPALAAQVREIVLMTGAVGEGNVTPAAEFNAWNDPEALAILLQSGCPVTLATLETTAQALCTPARVAALRAQGGGAPLRAACEIMARVPPSARLGGAGHPEHDACAVAWAVAPHLFTTRDVHAGVELAGPSRGRTNIARFRLPGPANARLLEKLDAEGFFALLGERLAALP